MKLSTVLGLVFSRDRAMQLDGALNSFLLHCKDPEDVRLFVIYNATDSRNARQYTKLSQQYAAHGSISFIEERRFRRDVLGLVLPCSAISASDWFQRVMSILGSRFGSLSNLSWASRSPRYVLFLVDDNIFVRGFSLRDVCVALEENPTALGFSLRLGRNTDYCYMFDKPQALPAFEPVTSHVLKYPWTDAECDFGYPLEVSSSIYRSQELLPLLLQLRFDNPNTLEAQMAAHTFVFKKTNPSLLCYEQSVTFCNPANKVQAIFGDNRAGTDLEYSPDRLAHLFDEGYQIKVESFSDYVPVSCHQEVDLVFERKEPVR